MIKEWIERMKREPWMVAVVVLIAITLWVASGMIGERREKDEALAVTGANAPPTEVQVERLAAQPVERVVSLKGSTAPARTVALKAETTGRVVAVGAPRGSRVGAGSLIARLDEADRLARVSQARATVKQRELEYDGQLKLKPAGYISDAKLAEAQALLETARAELARAELDVARMDIRAPFAGALQDRSVEIGDYVSAGTTVATFVDDRTLIVRGNLAESQATGVKRGLQGVARLASGETVEGTVRYLAPVADEQTRTFAIELEFANREGALPVGVTAEIDLPVDTVMAHRVSPALLTLDDTGVVGVKTVDDADRVVFVPAQVARSSAEGVWLTGLPDPARIITVGQGYVRPGQVVQAAPAAADPAKLAQE
jgi:multidrug efflux system membrane fusion protein